MCEQQAKTPAAVSSEPINRAQDDFLGGYVGVGAGLGIKRSEANRDQAVIVEVAVSANRGFEDALTHLKHGGRICRQGWNGRSQYVEVQRPDKNSKMMQPYAFIRTTSGDLVPWLPSQGDLFARDWALLPMNHEYMPF